MPKRIQEIQIKDIKPAKWNYKTDNQKILSKLKRNIKKNGQVQNIIVREIPNPTKENPDNFYYEVINGNHRLKAFKQLGLSSMVAFNLGRLSLVEAKLIALETNETNFTPTSRLGQLIDDIAHDFTLDDLTSTMPYTKRDMQTFIELLSIDKDQDDSLDKDDLIMFDKDDAYKAVSGDLYETNADEDTDNNDNMEAEYEEYVSNLINKTQNKVPKAKPILEKRMKNKKKKVACSMCGNNVFLLMSSKKQAKEIDANKVKEFKDKTIAHGRTKNLEKLYY